MSVVEFITGFVPNKRGVRGPDRSESNVQLIEKAKQAVASGECASMRAALQMYSSSEADEDSDLPTFEVLRRAYHRYKSVGAV